MISPWFHRVADLPLAWNILLKLTLLLMAAWGLHLAIRQRNPYWRVLLWRGFAAAAVATPLLVLAAPAIRIAVPAPSGLLTPAEPRETPRSVAGASQRLLHPFAPSASIDNPDSRSPEADNDLSQSVARATAMTPSAPQAPAPSSPFIADHWRHVVVAVWAAGIVLLASRWLLAWYRLQRMVSVSLPADDACQHSLRRVAHMLGCTRPVQLRVATGVPGPLLAGVRSPVILLPRGKDDAAHFTDLAAVLAHELTHLQNRDLPWMALLRSLAVVFWWHPLIWLVCRVHRQACEEACDAAAAGYVGGSETYSRALARLALASLGRSPALAGIPMARPAELMQRLARLSASIESSRPAMRRIALAGVLGAAVTVALSGIELVSAAASPAVLASPGPKSGVAGRILHFPPERSFGMLYVTDADFEPDALKPVDWGHYLCEARGDVAVPPGKRVRLHLDDKSGDNLAALSRLKPDDIYELWLGTRATDRCLPHLAHLTGLKVLEFPRPWPPEAKLPTFSPHSLKQLARLTSLERLKTPHGMNNVGLAAIVDAVPQLKGLTFDKNEVTDAGLAALPRLLSLEDLTIGGGRFTNAGLAHLAKMPALRNVWLWGDKTTLGNGITDDALREIRKIPGLKKFKAPSDLTEACLAHLAGHPSVETLDLHFFRVTDRGTTYLATMPALKKLNLEFLCTGEDIRHPPITKAGIAELKKLKKLEELWLPSVGFTDAEIAELGEMTQLKHLWVETLSESPLTDGAMKSLARLQNLEFLAISGKHLTAAGISSIASLSHLRTLILGTDEMSIEAMAKLAQLRALEFLSLNGKKFPLSGLNQLSGLPRLKILQIRGTADDVATLKLDRLPRLEHLSLSGKDCSLGDEDLACLANLKALNWVQVDAKEMTDAGMAHLAGLKDLDRLSIGGPNVTDRGLAILSRLKRLNHVTVTGNFTDAGLRQLEGLDGLQYLWIYSGTNISPAAKARLRKSLPNLMVFTADNDRSIAAAPKAEPATTQPASAHPKPGTPAPDFALTTLDGAGFKLSEQRGKVVILHFWGTWCRPCIAALPTMKKVDAGLKQKYGQRLLILNLAMDDGDEKVRNLVTSQEWDGLHARIGMYSQLAEDYGVTSAPDDFLIGPDGRILLNRESPEGPGDTEAVIEKALKKLDT